MNVPLVVIIVVATAAAVAVGIAFTIRGFKASDRAADADRNSQPAADNGHAAISRHDTATNDLLRRFFDGKSCAICKRPIPPVHRTGLKPGLYNPSTHETHSWDQIPNVNVASMLERELPVCSSCQVAESFRQRFPDRVLDRDRSAPANDRLGARS